MFAQFSIIRPPQIFLSQVRRLSIFSTFIFFLPTFWFTRFILTKKRAYLPWNFKGLSFPFMPIHFIINFHFIVWWFYRLVSATILPSIFRNFVKYHLINFIYFKIHLLKIYTIYDIYLSFDCYRLFYEKIEGKVINCKHDIYSEDSFKLSEPILDIQVYS